jgi:hypothetical protein
MSLEGTIHDLGLQEIGQLLALGRKSGVLAVRSTLRGTRAWLRFVDGALVDAGDGEAPPDAAPTAAAAAGDRAGVEEAVLEVLAWREGSFAFRPAAGRGGGASRVRIPADAMLVESARREDVWRRIRDRVTSLRAVPAFADVEPRALPLLHLTPAEWEVLTRIDGERDVPVHALLGTGLVALREAGRPLPPTPRPASPPSPAAPRPAPPPVSAVSAVPEAGVPAPDHDDLFPVHRLPASVASHPGSPSSDDGLALDVVPGRRLDAAVPDGALAAGDAAARHGEFASAIDCWTQYLQSHPGAPEADRVREAIGLAARLEALLQPASRT